MATLPNMDPGMYVGCHCQNQKICNLGDVPSCSVGSACLFFCFYFCVTVEPKSFFYFLAGKSPVQPLAKGTITNRQTDRWPEASIQVGLGNLKV
jgi:hypothetical protein